MKDKLTGDIKYTIEWLAAEYKFLKELHDDLERIATEPIDMQDKELKKDCRVVRYIGKAERRAERGIKEIISTLKEAKKSNLNLSLIEKQIREIEIPARTLLLNGSLYLGTLKKQLKSIRTSVKIEKKYPNNDHRALVQQEIGQLESKLKQLITWVTMLDLSLKKLTRGVSERDNPLDLIDQRILQHVKKVTELSGYKWPFNPDHTHLLYWETLTVISEGDLRCAAIAPVDQLPLFMKEIDACSKELSKIFKENEGKIRFEYITAYDTILENISISSQKPIRKEKYTTPAGEIDRILKFIVFQKQLLKSIKIDLEVKSISLDKIRQKVVALARKLKIQINIVNYDNWEQVVPPGRIIHGIGTTFTSLNNKTIIPEAYHVKEKFESIRSGNEWGDSRVKYIYANLYNLLISGVFSNYEGMAQSALNFNINPLSQRPYQDIVEYFRPFGVVFKEKLNWILESPIVPEEILNLVSPGRNDNGGIGTVLDKDKFLKLVNTRGFEYTDVESLEKEWREPKPTSDRKKVGRNLIINQNFLRALYNAKIFRSIQKGDYSVINKIDPEYGLRLVAINNQRKVYSVPATVDLIDKIIFWVDSPNADKFIPEWYNMIRKEAEILKKLL